VGDTKSGVALIKGSRRTGRALRAWASYSHEAGFWPASPAVQLTHAQKERETCPLCVPKGFR
jgi:hypothetical protein